MAEVKLAFDAKSVRRIDEYGRLHVSLTPISKAIVNGYYGAEIPGHKSLGLDPQKMYQMLRDPEELAKAAESFNNIPVMSEHVFTDAKSPQLPKLAGSTGTDSEFDAPYLMNSLVIFVQDEIDAIESGEKREISASYGYDPDMTPGVYDGVAYDGVMRNIKGNHVALVPDGRAGSDVLVYDSKTGLKMTTPKKKLTKDQLKALRSKISSKVAQDADLEGIVELLDMLDHEVNEPSDPEKDKKIVEDEDPLDFLKGKLSEEELSKLREMINAKTAKDEDDIPAEDDGEEDVPPKKKGDDTVSKTAMDSAIKAAFKQGVAEAARQNKELRIAEEDVRPLVGNVVAMDSAEAVYRTTLEAMGVDIKGVDPSAFRAMVGLIKSTRSNHSPTPMPGLANDAVPAKSITALFPALAAIKR